MKPNKEFENQEAQSCNSKYNESAVQAFTQTESWSFSNCFEIVKDTQKYDAEMDNNENNFQQNDLELVKYSDERHIKPDKQDIEEG